MTKLRCLGIENTDIDSGLEYLSESCKKFRCNSDDGYESAKFENELSRYSLGEGSKRYYNLER